MNTEMQEENKEKKNQNMPPKKRPIPPLFQKRQTKLPREEESPWGKFGKVFLSWIGVLLVVFLFMWMFRSNDETEYEVNFITFQQLLNDQKFSDAAVKISGYAIFDFHGKLKEPMDIQTASGKTARNATRITLTLPYTNLDDALVTSWMAKGLKFRVEKEDNTWMNAAISILPWILLLGIWLFIFRRMQSGAGGGG